MSRRTLASLIAAMLLAALIIAAVMVPVPYVTYRPGTTVDMLSEDGGEERVRVTGHPAYHDGGELRMTTVYVTEARDHVSLVGAMRSWLSKEESVEPYSQQYDEDDTPESNDEEMAVDMVSSQDTAIAAALIELGHQLTPVVEVLGVGDGKPADGKLEVRDRFVSAGGEPVRTGEALVAAVEKAGIGKPVSFVVERDGKQVPVEVTPADDDGKPRIGIQTGLGFEFPFKVSFGISPSIGGPSAGLMFALATYDTLTEGSLTGGHVIAGTGTISPSGDVGPIGGIPQKIVGAQRADAELFLVPADNCEEALGAPEGDMRLVRVETLKEARQAIETFVKDPDADLPSCRDKE